MSTTHIVAQEILVEGRWQRQRCGWCGEILMDNDLTLVAVLNVLGEEPRPPSAFTCGSLVRVTKGFPTSFVKLSDERLPDDACCVREGKTHRKPAPQREGGEGKP